MRFSVGFVLTALAISATASPMDQPKGTKISLAKRATVYNADGTANIKLLQGSLSTSVKYGFSFVGV